MYKIGLLGYGKMGSSIINGIVDANLYNKSEILIYNLDQDIVKKEGFNPAKNEIEVYENSEILILAIKPQTFPEIMEKLKNTNKKPQIVVSIAAGITLNYLKENLGENSYIRIMPNLGASIRMAVSTMALGIGVDEVSASKVKAIFDSIGTCTIVPEEQINVLLPVNGSYPAYFWYFVRSFIRSAVAKGACEDDVRKMIADASIGCAQMLKSSSKDLDTLINDVCSYKGTTIEGVYVFDEYNLDKIVDECSNKCMNRAKELEK